jgi:hypothetical protein
MALIGTQPLAAECRVARRQGNATARLVRRQASLGRRSGPQAGVARIARRRALRAPSVDASLGDDPLGRLARDRRNVIEVGVVVEHRPADRLSHGGDQQIGHLPALQATRGEQSLNLARPGEVTSIDVQGLEGLQGGNQAIPILAVAGGEPDLEVGHRRPSEAGAVKDLDAFAHGRDAKAGHDTGVDDEAHRQAVERSSSSALANTSSAWSRLARLAAAARRRASLTVSLMVRVPSSARAASSAASSTSISRFVTVPVYIRDACVYRARSQRSTARRPGNRERSGVRRAGQRGHSLRSADRHLG